ncbi:hypothetical protein F5X96DRAFT_695590 [Biscogniauxia mediterranea]|nr:hypothetical protein F5X96DRAFT_695590 [Biscogniauxia mediterranea]
MTMADFDNLLNIQDEEQLWTELDKVVATQCPADAHETIDDALRSWLYLASRCRYDFSEQEDDVANCSQTLLGSNLFRANADYVRTQIIYSLLQEDEVGPLYAISTFLLLDGRSEEATFKKMINESCFHRLLELINGRKEQDPGLHRLLLELLYEMARMEQLRIEDLVHVDDGFVTYLFQLIEELSDDAHDPYHYPIIRVLLVLNEQYMVASATAAADPTTPAAALTNRVVKCLSLYGDHYRTFGENIILLLNRETETSLQLLILKLLYLLFTTKATYEYFYTNDLHVLVDVIIRNLLDLPDEVLSLRHTYLRVLYPLLAHTQLSQYPHYKKDEIQKVIKLLASTGNAHFAPADETTLRLVDRVSKVKWLSEDGPGAGDVARKLIGMSISPTHTGSSISVVDLTAVTEKPGVQTPSRKAEVETEVQDSSPRSATSETNGVNGGEKSAFRKEAPKVPPKVAPRVAPRVPPKPTSKEPPKLAAPRPKKPLPEVPKHKHGIPVVSAPAVQPVNGDGKSVKKSPPKPPPRRKARLKTVTTTTEMSTLVPEIRRKSRFA